MKKVVATVASSLLLVCATAGAAFAADPSPGNSGHEGLGAKTAECSPAATPGCGK